MKLIRTRGRKTRQLFCSKRDIEDLKDAITVAILRSPEPLKRSEWSEPGHCERAAQDRAWRRLLRKLR